MSKRSIALISPIAPIWTRSSSCSPRYEYRRASDRTSDMYCSISCSLAWRSPSSWYRRRRTLSLSGTRPPLGQPNGVPIDVHVVDGGIEHAPHSELGARVALERIEQPPVERS